jgi:chain length determinant protein (polysaccharide antigen chain regulator)
MRSNESDEIRANDIDLVRVFNIVWVQKWLIFAITLVVASVFALYAFLTTPTYEAKFYISPPTLDNVANLNYGRNGELKPFTVDDVYKVFLRNLQSQTLRQSFYREVYLPNFKASNSGESAPESYDRFSNRVSAASLDKDPVGRWSLSIQDSSPEIAASWVSLYAAKAGQLAQREVISNATKEASVIARNLKLQINSLREAGKKLREDTIFRLSEALAVAKATGLEKSVVFVGERSSELAGDMVGGSAYMRGTKVLEAELENLKARESNDPFIPGLRQLQTSYEFYKGIELDEYKVSVYRQDGDVQEPVSPIKPKKIMLIVLGIVLGGLLGVVVALARGFRTERLIK